MKNEPHPSVRVLFVEDSPEDVRLARQTLDEAGIAVELDVASTQQEFEQRVAQQAYDVVVADYRLPGWNGMETVPLLAAAGLDTPVILFSGALGEERAVECLKEGASDYVLKSRLQRLPVAISRTLDERRRRQEQARAGEALRQSEAGLRALVDRAVYAIFRCSVAEDRFLRANPALVRLLGYESEAEVLALRLSRDVFVDGANTAKLLSRPAGEELRGVETRWRRRDGSEVLVLLNGRAVKGAPDPHLEVITEDVTERRRATQRIEQVNSLYLVLSHVGQTILRVRDRAGLFREICRVAVEYGRFRMAWVGAVDASGRLQPLVHSGAELGYLQGMQARVPAEPEWQGPAAAAMREGTHVICRDVTHDPRMAPWRSEALRRGYFSVAAFPIRAAGVAIGVLVVYAAEPDFFDSETIALMDEVAAAVSSALDRMSLDEQRRQAEDEVTGFFAASPDILAIVDAGGYLRRINPACERILGYRPDELLGRPVWPLVDAADEARMREQARKLQSGAEVQGLEVRLRTRHGKLRWLLVNAAAGPGQSVFYLNAADVTARMQMEEAREQMRGELARSNDELERFAWIVSHDLQEPLRMVASYTQLLARRYGGKLDAKADQYIEYAVDGATRMEALISSLLTYSRVGTRKAVFEAVSGEEALDHALANLRAAIQDSRAVITHGELPEVVADGAQLVQLFQNLIGNAIRFRGEEPPRIHVAVTAHQRGWLFSVEDNGIGIEREYHDHIFGVFQRLHTHAEYPGTGIGLAICKRIVERHGGEIWLESEPGKGSKFWVLLPQHAPVASQEVASVRER